MTISDKFKQFIKCTPFFYALRTFLFHARDKKAVRKWENNQRHGPPPHSIKQKNLLRYARLYSLRIFVETGTLYGDMVQAVKHHFELIYSIELNPVLFAMAKARFKSSDHIHIVCGDSGKELGNIIGQLDHPTLFWLDGHYSGPGTAKGSNDTPIYEELEAVAKPLFGVKRAISRMN
jgi:hypothetical protein